MASLNKAKASGLEAITVRRTKIVDAEKVRYRVYSNPSEFVAVIAESALMAVKVAGAHEPYRIVRDLPTEGIINESEKIARAEVDEKIAFSRAHKASSSTFKADMSKAVQETAAQRFTPMTLREFGQKGMFNEFAIPHTVMNQLIEEMQKKMAEKATSPPPPPAAPAPATAEPAPPPPPIATAPMEEPVTAAPVGNNEVLSPQEVEKLLRS